jgi:spermidine/putrescine transport system substrate-binding protein
VPPIRRSRHHGHLTRRQLLQATLGAATGVSLSSCGWTLANVQTTVRTDPSLLYIYTWAGYTDNALLDSFYKETGVRVIADVYSSNEEMLAKLQAGAGGAYSVIYPSDYMLQKMVRLNLVQELDRARLVGLDRLFSKFKSPLYDPNNQYSLPLSWGTTGLVYNKNVISPAPDDWDYLWDNQASLFRRMTLLNDPREVIGAAIKSLGYSYNTTNPDEIRQGYERLLELKPAIASFESDSWRSQILTGDLKIAMCYSADANEVAAENSDLIYTLPRSGSSIWTDTLAIPTTAPNPDAAYAWLNFMLEPEIAAKTCARLSFATPNKAAFQVLPPEVQENPSLFPSEATLAQSEGLTPIPIEIEELYDFYWTKLTSS